MPQAQVIDIPNGRRINSKLLNKLGRRGKGQQHNTHTDHRGCGSLGCIIYVQKYSSGEVHTLCNKTRQVICWG